MQFSLVLAPLVAMVCTPLFLFLLKPLAWHLELIDHPSAERKHHNGSVPLTGGLAILLSLSVALSISGIGANELDMVTAFWPVVGLLLAFLVIAHAIDDILELNATTRLLIDGSLALCLCTWAMIKIVTLGELFGMGEVTLGRFAVAMTVFSFIAASNAFNMTDGIDSLCSGLGLVAFATLIVLLSINGDPAATPLINVLGIIIFALIPMYFANLGKLGAGLRSFLGDSGARLIGFMAAIAVIMSAAQGFIDPVLAFFPIAVPVCDCLILMAVRVAHKKSPFSADRRHMHHLLVDTRLSICQARRVEIWLATGFSIIGVGLHVAGTQERIVSILVVSLFAAYIALRFWLAERALKRPLIEAEPEGNVSADLLRKNAGGS